MPTPILYAPNGQAVAFELTGEEKYVELLLVAFGLLSGVMFQSGEAKALAGQHGCDEPQFVNIVCSEIVKLLGESTIKGRFPGLKLQMAPTPAEALKAAAEAEGPSLGPMLVGSPEPG